MQQSIAFFEFGGGLADLCCDGVPAFCLYAAGYIQQLFHVVRIVIVHVAQECLGFVHSVPRVMMVMGSGMVMFVFMLVIVVMIAVSDRVAVFVCQ